MRYLFLLLAVCGAIFLTPTVASAEIISNFSSVYTIASNGEVSVQETIVYDFEDEARHGMFRVLEKSHPQAPTAWYKNRYVAIEDVAVTRNGNSEPFSVTNSIGEVEIKIGDADSTVTGVQTYQISYRLHGALSFGAAGAEFYWNVTGNDWSVPIMATQAVVISDAFEGTTACYVGEVGSSDTCASQNSDGNQVTFTSASLSPGEGLTIAAELQSDKVLLNSTERISFLPFGLGLALVWFIFLIWYTYRFHTQEKVHLPVIAQYEPYAGYLPMYTGVLLDGRLDPHDITAGILYLAEQGFLKITKTTRKVLFLIEVNDYDVTLLRPLTDVPALFLSDVMTLLFPVDAAVGTVVAVSDIAKNATENTVIVQSLQKSIKADLAASGFTTTSLPVLSPGVKLGVGVVYIVFASFLFVPGGLLVPIVVGFYSIVAGVFLLIPRWTKKGYEAKNHTEGFKLFLSVTDKERFDFHNAPEKSPELFMKYLPYAVALQVEEKWAKVFADITIPNPDWYEGGNFGAFSAVALASDLGSFSSSFAASSGTGGSSGGGSSGGGGGGGGGGSW